MSEIFGVYEGIRNEKVEADYNQRFVKVEAPIVRSMTTDEMAKYGVPTMLVTQRIRGFEQLNESKGRGRKSRKKVCVCEDGNR